MHTLGRPTLNESRATCPQAWTAARWFILAILALVQVRGQDSAERKCLQHSDCEGAGEFCAVQMCSTWEGFEFPCGICGPCSLCRCHGDSMDRVCPSSCPPPAGEIRKLHGTFTNSDQHDGSTCLRIWTFDGMRFRRHDTGLTHAEAYRSNFYLNPTDSKDGERLTPKPSWDSPCKPSTTTGHFSFEESEQHGRFVLTLSTPIHKPSDAELVNGVSYSVEKIQAKSDCPRGLLLSFADGTADLLRVSSPSTIFPQEDAVESPRYAELLDLEFYSGTISLHETVCSIVMQFSPAGAPGLVYFSAITQECVVGRTLAPEMPEPEKARENQDHLRRRPVERDIHEQVGHRREEEEAIAPPIALTRLNTMSVPKAVNLSHYDWNVGRAVNMELCQRRLGIANTSYTTSRGCYPFPNNTHSRCVQYSLKDNVLSSLQAAGDGDAVWTNTWVETYKYDCRCEIGYYDAGCLKSGQPGSMRCGDTNMQGWNGTAETGWNTTKELFEGQACECGVFCSDINECDIQTHNCHAQSVCTNTNGSFTCTCNVGFWGSGSWCEDLQECDEGTHNCFEHATCSNTYGSFTCACNTGFSGSGIHCEHVSQVMFERVWPLAVDLEWSILWKIQTPPHVEDLVSVYRIEGPLFRLAGFYFASAAPCSTASSCVGECVMPCHLPGSLENKDDWQWASQLFRTISLGSGTYRAVLFSMQVMEIVATHDFNVTSDTIEVKAPYTERIVPAGSGRAIVGGLVGCEALNVGSKCCIGVNWTVHGKSCVEIPDPVKVEEEVETIVEVPQRCGDGRLELGSAPFHEPLGYAGQRDGRVEECDDGNNVDEDGCDAGCRIEANSNCTYYHNTNISQVGTSMVLGIPVPIFQMGNNPKHLGLQAESLCVLRFCGDGIRNVDGEECDDGETSNHPLFLDGCRGCKVDLGWSCRTQCVMAVRPDLTQYEECRELCSSFVMPLPDDELDEFRCPVCRDLEECVYFEYEYKCRCRTGYATSINYQTGYLVNQPRTADPSSTAECIDVDECRFARIRDPISEMPGGSCEPSANCTNIVGGFECECPPNFNGTGYPGSPCIDIDECMILAMPCHRDAECINFPSGYGCKCKTGYRGEGLRVMTTDSPLGCVDIDECAEGTDTCRITQTCLNQEGSYYCQCNEGMVPYNGECFPPNYWQNNAPFLNRMGWHGPRSTQGLLRLMESSNFVRFSSTGLGWWLFLDGSLQAHHVLFSMGAVAPNHGSQAEWDPIQCYSEEASVVLDQSRGWIKQMQWTFRRKVNTIFVLAPALNTSITQEQIIRIKFHVLYLKPNDAILICQASCQTLHHQDAQELLQTGLDLPAISGTLTLKTGALPEPLFDSEQCSDVPGWSGMIFLGAGRCKDITYAFAEKICVAENQDAKGVSALEACCICGGGSMDQAPSREFSIENSYTKRRYAMVASYHVGTDSLQDKNAADTFFAEHARALQQEAARHRQQRPLKHKLAIANGVDAKLGFPECLNKHRITDYGSTIVLEKGTSAGEPLLHGMWKGTCSPREFGGGTKTCNVHLSVRSNIFEWSIDGCVGFNVDRFATGMLRHVHDEVRSVVDRYTNVASLNYKLVDVLYSTGAPALAVDDSSLARGVFGWKDITSLTPKDEIIFSVGLPGDKIYPGEDTANGDFTFQSFPCQVSELRRIHESDLQIPLPKRLPPSESRMYLIAFELYQACNESISRMEPRNAACRGILDGLIGTRVPLEGLSEEQLISAEEACLNARCFIPFNSSMYAAIDTCRRARIRFRENAMSDPRLEAMDRFFSGRLVFLAETHARIESTCTSNFMKKSCRRVMGVLKSSEEPGCVAQGTVADASLPIGASAALSFNMKGSSQEAGQCTAGCKLKFSRIAQNMHCCVASFYEGQSLWMDIVAPEQRHVSIDLRAYRCLYQEGFDCRGAPREQLALSRDYLPDAAPPEYPSRIHLNEACDFSGKQSLKCSFHVCDSDRLADGVTPPVLPWPKPCCRGFKCLNGGTLPFSGACFCICPTQFVRADCSESLMHLSFALALEGAEYHRFNLGNAVSILAKKSAIEQTQIEISSIDVMDARRRHAAEPQGLAAAAIRAPSAKHPGYRRAVSGLHVGFRILLDSERELTRVKIILDEAIAKGDLRQPFADLGLGEATGYSQPPVLVRVGDTAADASKSDVADADGTTDTEAASESPLALFDVTTVIAIVLGVCAAIGCGLACRRLPELQGLQFLRSLVEEWRGQSVLSEEERREKRYSSSNERYASRYDRSGSSEPGSTGATISKASNHPRTSMGTSQKGARDKLRQASAHKLKAKILLDDRQFDDTELGRQTSQQAKSDEPAPSPGRRAQPSIKDHALAARGASSSSDLECKSLPSHNATIPDSALGQNHAKLLDLEKKATNLQKIITQHQLRRAASISPVDESKTVDEAGVAISNDPAIIKVHLNQGVARSAGRRHVPSSDPSAAEAHEASSSASEDLDVPAIPLWHQPTPRLDRPWLEELRKRDARLVQARAPSVDTLWGSGEVGNRPSLAEAKDSRNPQANTTPSFFTEGMSLKQLRAQSKVGQSEHNASIRLVSDHDTDHGMMGLAPGRAGRGSIAKSLARAEANGVDMVSATIGHLSEAGVEEDEVESASVMVSLDTARSTVSFNALKARLTSL